MASTINSTRRLRNKPEDSFRRLATEKGWQAIKQGWPDFFVFNEDGFFVVEVKGRGRSGNLHNPSRYQSVVLKALKKAGIKTFLSDGKDLLPY